MSTVSKSLFEPISIGGLELENRTMRSATWDATAEATGAVSDRSLAMYEALGQGGIGLIVSGFAFVSSHGQAVERQYGVHTDDMIPGLRRLAIAAKRGGSKIALQIVHAGINSSWLRNHGQLPLAASTLPVTEKPHREMADAEIEAIADDFKAAAVRGREAGFDAIQLHGAHAYFMSQIISPLYNHRTDRWGGTAENRRLFHLEVVRRIRGAIGPDFPLLIKFGAMDDSEGGLTLSEGIEAVKEMSAAGLDGVEISAGVGQAVPRSPSTEVTPFRERAAAVRAAVSIPVAVVAGIRSLEVAVDIVSSGDADQVSMCRPFIREPHLVARWQRGDIAPATCISCNRCMLLVRRGQPLECGEDRRLREQAAGNSSKPEDPGERP